MAEDFEQRVREDGYRNPVPYTKETRETYHRREGELTGQFMTDLTIWLEENGVPAQYAAKVAYRAWEEGHAYGYAEVFTVAQGLLEIFQ